MDVKLDRERERVDTLKKKIAEIEASQKHAVKLAKEEIKKVSIERDESNKQIAKLLGKERQYCNEIRNKEREMEKISEQLKAKMFRDKQR